MPESGDHPDDFTSQGTQLERPSVPSGEAIHQKRAPDPRFEARFEILWRGRAQGRTAPGARPEHSGRGKGTLMKLGLHSVQAVKPLIDPWFSKNQQGTVPNGSLLPAERRDGKIQ